jgi:hypothetical protein
MGESCENLESSTFSGGSSIDVHYTDGPFYADHIKALSGIRPAISREATAMRPGDEALVVRRKYRVADPGQKAGYQPGPHDWEYGLLVIARLHVREL